MFNSYLVFKNEYQSKHKKIIKIIANIQKPIKQYKESMKLVDNFKNRQIDKPLVRLINNKKKYSVRDE